MSWVAFEACYNGQNIFRLSASAARSYIYYDSLKDREETHKVKLVRHFMVLLVKLNERHVWCILFLYNILIAQRSGFTQLRLAFQTKAEGAHGLLRGSPWGDEQDLKNKVPSCRGEGHYDGQHWEGIAHSQFGQILLRNSGSFLCVS